MVEKTKLPPLDARPSFIKIIFPVELTDLTIPPEIVERMYSPRKKKNKKKAHTIAATLRGPFGDSEVNLLQKDGSICFEEKGWEMFLKKHSIMKYELLAFKYNGGGMSFDVAVLGLSGCSKSYASGDSMTTTSSSSSSSAAHPPPPFFHATMKASNVGSFSNLVIPKEFMETGLGGCNRTTVTLRNAKGVSWLVGIIPFCKKYAYFSKGWKAFAEGNGLKKGDVCVFKLVEENVMEVQIISVSLGC